MVLLLHFILIITIVFCTLHLPILLFCISPFIFVELKHTFSCVLEAQPLLMIHARLVKKLAFDDETAAQQRMRIRRNFGTGSKADGNFGKVGAWADKQKEKNWAEKEPDRRVKGSREQKSDESWGHWRIKRMEAPVSSFIRSFIFHQHILQLHISYLYILHLHLQSCILTALFHPLHHIVALDIRIKARYIRRQGCSL